MDEEIVKPTEDNWINGIDKNEPWKYLWQFDALIWDDKGFVEYLTDEKRDEYFCKVIRYEQWYKDFMNAFKLNAEASYYYFMFEYLGKDPETMMRDLTNMALQVKSKENV